MYHPRNGRCISHNTAEFALSCNHGLNNGICGLAIGTHNDMLYNLIVRQEPFLSMPTENVVFGLRQRDGPHLVPYDTLTLLFGDIDPIVG